MIKYTKDILIYQASQKLDLYSQEEISNIAKISEMASKQDLLNMIYELSELETDIKWSTQKTIIFQAGMIKLCNQEKKENNDLAKRIENIEKYLKSGKLNMAQQPAISRPVNNQLTQNQIAPSNFGVNQNRTSIPKERTAKKVEQKNYSSDAKNYWPEILTDLKSSGKIVLYTNLMNTRAKELNDMTVGIEFPTGMTAFGKTVLEKPENVREISKMVSMACGKDMQIKYIPMNNEVHQITNEENLQNLANESDIPFNIIE